MTAAATLEERLRMALRRAADAGVEFRGPASPSEVAELEALVGASLPDDFRAFLALHDGAEEIGIADHEDVMSVAEMIEHLGSLQAMFRDDEPTPVSENPPGVAPWYWVDGWLPFTRDGGGSYRCLDLAPDVAAGGRRGQVIEYVHAEAVKPLVAGSFLQWLERVEWTVEDE